MRRNQLMREGISHRMTVTIYGDNIEYLFAQMQNGYSASGFLNHLLTQIREKNPLSKKDKPATRFVANADDPNG